MTLTRYDRLYRLSRAKRMNHHESWNHRTHRIHHATLIAAVDYTWAIRFWAAGNNLRETSRLLKKPAACSAAPGAASYAYPGRNPGVASR